MRRIRIESGPLTRRGRTEQPPGLKPLAELASQDIVVTCPRCDTRSPIAPGVCQQCGFPFACDIAPLGTPALRLRGGVFRTLLGAAAIIFLLTSGVFLHTGYYEFHGLTTAVVAGLQPAEDSGIPIKGPPLFVQRTELTLGLLKLRAPDFYWRLQDSVSSIEYLAPTYLESDDGRRISLEGIGAVARSDTGEVLVLYSTAFPSGPSELYDRDVFSYAGILVHELRHIELHQMGLAPEGWQEEVLCERAAYAAVTQAQAPPAVLLRYEIYLENPRAKRYQKWYDWYNQQE